MSQATPQEFARAFGLSHGIPSDFEPLLLSLNSSSTGEIAQSFGLFDCRGLLYEVIGTECSVWEFNGQWDPEPTTVESLMRRLDEGSLGLGGDGEDHFASALRQLLQPLAGRPQRGFTMGDRLRLTLAWPPDAPHAQRTISIQDSEAFARVFAARLIAAAELVPCFDGHDDQPVARLQPGRRFYAFEREGLDVFLGLDAAADQVLVYAGSTGMRHWVPPEQRQIIEDILQRLQRDIDVSLQTAQDVC